MDWSRTCSPVLSNTPPVTNTTTTTTINTTSATTYCIDQEQEDENNNDDADIMKYHRMDLLPTSEAGVVPTTFATVPQPPTSSGWNSSSDYSNYQRDDAMNDFSNSQPGIRSRNSPMRDDTTASPATTPYVALEIINMPHLNNAKDNNDECEMGGNNDENKDDSSVETQDGIQDIPGFWCVCMVILIGDMSRGVFFPSLWPLVESLGGNKVRLGYAVAAFSLGRILVNPLFGSWSHTYGYSPTLLLSCVILFLGTVLYAQVQTVAEWTSNDHGLQYLILSQTVLGIGSGTLGVTRAFVADVTARRNRTKYMGWITAVQYGGFTVTPAFGALFNVLLGDTEYRIWSNSRFLRINMYTTPAYFMALIVLSTIIVLLVIFRDRYRVESVASKGKKSQKRQTIDEAANRSVVICPTWASLRSGSGNGGGVWSLTVYDCCILGCMLLNIATKGSIASFETLGIVIAEEYFAMVASRAGIIIAVCGVCGVLALLNLGYLEQRFIDVHIITGGMLIMIVGIGSLVMIDDAKLNNPDWTYALAMFLIYSIGYPIGHTAVIGLFSKIVGRRPQGELLGWFASAGSLARIIFPVMSGYIANFSSMEMVFATLIGVLLLSTAFILWANETLTLLSS